MSALLNIRQLIALFPEGFLIPAYQRHYVWGQQKATGKDASSYLTHCLIKAYLAGQSYFLQGLTTQFDKLIDGQQRVTYISLLLRYLEYENPIKMRYANRDNMHRWMESCLSDYHEINEDDDQDIYLGKRTLNICHQMLVEADIDKADFLNFVLEKIQILHIPLNPDTDEILIYRMMNGSKACMEASDLIKADIMRLATDNRQPNAYEWELSALRMRYAHEWESWVRWWHRDDVKEYYETLSQPGIDLLIKLCLRNPNDELSRPLTYDEFKHHIIEGKVPTYHNAKHIFDRFRRTQQRFEDAYNDTSAYNRIKAILLLQPIDQQYQFLRLYFVDAKIDDEELLRYYKLSFLGMSIDDIYNHVSAAERFDDLVASLSMKDVYHSETKRDVFNLLLRLNIDEDIKLKRKFDFSIWNNRSLEHIYSKSKVWHNDNEGKIFDGNDNELHIQQKRIEKDPTFIHRNLIVNKDGTQLSEHCIGNLVLLYGENNASFGNATFEQKKMMFLTPGDSAVFQSRNLLHTVCVFAGNHWDHNSIVANYNQTLKNLKDYYGFK